ncbi:hypothetical protein ElyMa_006666800 [Elysia marginata]|uniref:Uncharacterized protein n=1 Tax=Elysia marginata TaxID=1093978 RepID=A0AAV4IRC4_9GAST|nr:hypothetical protein ElyMa_006666800 [Elysia marginata]
MGFEYKDDYDDIDDEDNDNHDDNDYDDDNDDDADDDVDRVMIIMMIMMMMKTMIIMMIMMMMTMLMMMLTETNKLVELPIARDVQHLQLVEVAKFLWEAQQFVVSHGQDTQTLADANLWGGNEIHHTA